MRRESSSIFSSWTILFLVFVSSYLISLGISRIYSSHGASLYRLKNGVSWISAADSPGGTSYYRRSFSLPAKVKNAWVMIGAKDSFELIANGNTVGRYFYWRPTRPFQNGSSEPGQRITKSRPALSLNYPREYQWSGHKSYRLPVYFDLGPYLAKGNNVIALKVQSRGSKTSFFAKGEVRLSTDEVVSIGTDKKQGFNSEIKVLNSWWKATRLPNQDKEMHWGDLAYNDRSWQAAKPVNADQNIYQTFSEDLYSSSFEAPVLTASSSDLLTKRADGVWFSKTWELQAAPREAWIRIYANRHFSAFINGKPLKIPNRRLSGQDSGEWIAQTARGQDLPAEPELLDPDEIGEYFSGSQFEKTPHSDPTTNNFRINENRQNQTKERPFAAIEEVAEDLPSVRGSEASGFDPRSYRPDRPTPRNLTRHRSEEKFFLYSIRGLLRKGQNIISVRMNNPSPQGLGPKVALDGKAYFSTGQSSVLKTDQTWEYQIQYPGGEKIAPRKAVLSTRSGLNLPKREYRGRVYSFLFKLRDFGSILALTFVSLAISLCLLLQRAKEPERVSSAIVHSLYLLCLLISSALLLESTFWERHERMFFMKHSSWILVLLLASLLSLFCYWRMVSKRNILSKILERFVIYREKLNPWPFLVFTSLAACFFIRVFKLDHQPLDDDEYSSTQAVLSISRSGLPRFDGDIWYTRSPLYHYLIGGLVRVFGENIWSLRLPSVFFAVLTALLIYLIGKELFKSKAIGLASMLLYALHPFAIYSAHIARFYQQQQFFYALTVYFFIKGFVVSRDQRFAYATLFSFLCAVLSQEISVILGLQLALAYLVFAKKRPVRDDLRLVVAASCVILLIAIDLIIFQTKCLTRLEGVSPNLEATIALNFNSPMNFLSLFIAYSRLHIALSLFFFLGLPFSLRKNNSIVLILYFFTFSGVLLTNTLVTGLSLRYQYSLIPFWLLLAVYGSWSLTELAGDSLRANRPSRHKWFVPLSFSILFTVFLASFSPWRISESYDEKILGDSTGALTFVKTQLREGDKVAITEPHPHAARIELGQVDYDLAIPLLYDFAYSKNGVLVDRNGGAEILAGVADLEKVIAQHERLWVLVNREKFRSRGKNIRWEYPGARAELFLRKNFEVVHESYLWTVFLWDAKKGRYHSFKKN